ncbi:hypothetical protein [Wolbachia endosymbiont of Folsomia candida]|uniref:hypothetical protein n=1 Tax=Wolbachia endosymbiont of Folsomia candida TaxID=169402 RepID=UPI000AA524F8|nr:hypothetical protein [Wolbachia endosymbiont of Folsomia candida]APR98412.1 hypothetical protein ASM33_03955 [Wolbachia endosymbiont of Folsomia candida]
MQDFLDAHNFIKNMKEHARREVKNHVDNRTEDAKHKAAISIRNKVLNNMLCNKPLSKPKKNKLLRITCNPFQNQEVINALFVGKTLVWNRSNSGESYKVKVEKGGRFINCSTGTEIAKSPSTACRILAGSGSYNGWTEFKVCLDPQEGLQTLCYHRSKFFSNTAAFSCI